MKHRNQLVKVAKVADEDSKGLLEPIGPSSLSRSDICRFYAGTGYNLVLHPTHLVRRLHQKATAHFQDLIGSAEDLTPTQYAVLATLLRLGSISQNRLGRLTAVDSSTISMVFKKLVQRGRVRRGASLSDQRKSMILLTDEGVGCGLEYLDRSMEVGRRLLAPLSPSERAVLLELLHRLVKTGLNRPMSPTMGATRCR